MTKIRTQEERMKELEDSKRRYTEERLAFEYVEE
jgi:hypothetical protein